MKKYLAVTVDVEPDSSSGWQYSDPLQFEGVHVGIKDRLQPLFMEYGIVPTYLVSNIVLENPSCVDTLGNLPGDCELGTHLHPEFIEPAKRFSDYAGKKGEANCCFYPPEIEFEKIQNITILFENAFGFRPKSFRAGRYSAGINTIKSLVKLGYQVDSSITPHVLWDDRTREFPVDFTGAPEQPYWISEEAITREDHRGELLEIPISIQLKRRNAIREFIVAGGGLRRKLRKHKPVWLRPFFSSANEMIGIAEQFCEDYQYKDKIVLNMMFHNVEVLPGLSPYTHSESDCVNYLNQMVRFFRFCRQDNFIPLGLNELYKSYRPEI
jgi:hypothetical protein